MSKSGMVLRTAGNREAGVACPYCRRTLGANDPVVVCTACGTPHHPSCWERGGACGSYACAPAHRDLGEAPGALVISPDDLAGAVPLPTHPADPFALRAEAAAPRRPEPPRRMSVIALAAAACGAVTLGLLTLGIRSVAAGPAVTVLSAVAAALLGVIALAGMSSGRRKGIVFAAFAVVAGVGGLVGAATKLTNAAFQADRAVAFEDLAPPEPAELERYQPAINRAMRSNVLIHTRGGLLQGIGSGVVVRLEPGWAVVVTNRHVVDPAFDDERDAAGDAAGASPEVYMVGQAPMAAKVAWVAPGSVDLAALRVPCNTGEVRAARWEAGRAARVGDATFAVGNPHGLGWTYTQGNVSQFRTHAFGGRRLRVVQITTALNPGNSGGGLYDKDGFLIGINTWVQDKRVSEGLNFAISADVLAELLPADLRPNTDKREKP